MSTAQTHKVVEGLLKGKKTCFHAIEMGGPYSSRLRTSYCLIGSGNKVSLSGYLHNVYLYLYFEASNHHFIEKSNSGLRNFDKTRAFFLAVVSTVIHVCFFCSEATMRRWAAFLRCPVFHETGYFVAQGIPLHLRQGGSTLSRRLSDSPRAKRRH